MEKFKSLDEFRAWADKYGITYEEKHEFSEDVPQGEVISYSHKKGDTIKNGDSIIVTISDGKECKVPDVVGMSKKEAIEALEDAGLNYNFVTQSSSKSKNTVIKQSISAGSKVSSGTTITVTLSSGKNTEHREDSSSSGSSSSGSNSGNNNSGGSTPTPSPEPEPDPEPVCTPCTITGLRPNVYNKYSGFDAVASALKSYISGQCPGITVIVNGDTTSDKVSGMPVSGFNGGDTNSCDTITITIAK